MNYFNYFTEIEEVFIRRRGKHLLLSPMDWALIESWKEKGVPLHVALRGVERAFDSHDAKPRRRSVKSLMYCQEEVEAQYAEWLDSQVGASPVGMEDEHGREQSYDEAHLPFPRDAILEHLARGRATLLQIWDKEEMGIGDGLRATLSRAASRLGELKEDFVSAARPDAERLEASLASLERMLDEALRARVSREEFDAIRAEAELQLHPYRDRMERATYEQTLENLLMKRLRDHYGVPRLSLFYL
ncbi:MAG TPA: hypothetical protein VD966_11935 [Pyrinomonadaceae bacterium]|nr:hypothetical protein [Pyrinomonadaceae bacterium]